MSVRRDAVMIGLNAVVVAVSDDTPRVLVVPGAPGDRDALPFGPFDPVRDRTLERGLRRWVDERTKLALGYVEQLYTFGDRARDPHEARGGPRTVSVGYLALVRDLGTLAPARAVWQDWFAYCPWEDRRAGPPPLVAKIIARLKPWTADARAPAVREARRERVAVCFGASGGPWNSQLALERYELMYEAGLVAEADFDAARPVGGPSGFFGKPMALDHRRMLATAIGRVRGKITYRPVVFELLPPAFTLFHLQRTVEALAGRRLHKANFRRLVESAGLVDRTGGVQRSTGGRPADEFRFRREVLLERPAPGLRIGR